MGDYCFTAVHSRLLTFTEGIHRGKSGVNLTKCHGIYAVAVSPSFRLLAVPLVFIYSIPLFCSSCKI